ncbi:MAG: hypothetical protein JO156_05965 [Solirubrobacterales bacterium]|nr:hypothetical protein [Solirubrobacterales bacterium]
MRLSRLLPTAVTLAGVLALSLALSPAPALASGNQIAMFQDGIHLMADPGPTLQTIRKLGATTVRVVVFWSTVAPSPRSHNQPHFNQSDPNAYPASGWAPYDAIVRYAQDFGITVDLTVAGGSPLWADGSGIDPKCSNPHFACKPSARDYGQFMQAIGKRYSGTFTPPGQASPLPAVHFWAIWNEPNFGEDLGPQAVNGSTLSVAPGMYRSLVDAGWSALHATGHGHDTILIGELAARGSNGSATSRFPQGFPGTFGQTKPLQFIRTLYCVDSSYRPLRGGYAAARGCPTNAAGSRHFRSQHPGLFQASGFGDHPYPLNLSPVLDGRSDPDYAAFPDLGRLGGVLDHVQRVYGSGTRFPIYNDEYGYITDPPATQQAPGGGHYVSPATGAYYINWAEYLSWRNPRVKTTMQYLLYDPPPGPGPYAGFASGLITGNGHLKPAYSAYRLPLYMPVTSASHNRNLEVWGCARPAHFSLLDTGASQSVQIQFQRGSHGSFTTLKTVPITNAQGYFDVHMKFSGSGTVRLAWTYPSVDMFLPGNALGVTVYSRSVQLNLH